MKSITTIAAFLFAVSISDCLAVEIKADQAHNQMSKVEKETGIEQHLNYEINACSKITLDLSGLSAATLKQLESADTIYKGGFGQYNFYGRFDQTKKQAKFSAKTLKEKNGEIAFTGFGKRMHSLTIGKMEDGKLTMFFVAIVKARKNKQTKTLAARMIWLPNSNLTRPCHSLNERS
ncbi:MAG: hypothetical protein ACKVJU_14515 [Verrucomicrobiales bacterium]